jgi:hypothetical protein
LKTLIQSYSLAGEITGTDDFEAKFREAQMQLQEAVVNVRKLQISNSSLSLKSPFFDVLISIETDIAMLREKMRNGSGQDPLVRTLREKISTLKL